MLFLLFSCSQNFKVEEPSLEDPAADFQPVENPSLQMDTPARGAFVPEDSVQLSGSFSSGSAGVSSLTLNGEPIEYDGGGDFSLPVASQPGIQQLNLRAEASDGGRAVSSRSVYAGRVHEEGAWVEEAVRIQINQDLLDDGEPDLDDLASIAEVIVADLDLSSSLLGTTFEVSIFDIEPQSISYGDPQIAIFAGDPLHVVLEVPNIDVTFNVSTYLGVNVDGQLTADNVQLKLDIALDTTGGNIVTTVESAESTISNAEIDIEYIPGFAEDWVIDLVVGQIEEELETVAVDLITETAAEYLESFALETELLTGVFVESALTAVQTVNDGLRLILDAKIFGTAAFDMPDNAGSLATGGAGPAWPIGTTPLAVAIDDDLINQLMFVVWQVGTLRDIQFDAILLEGLSGAPLPEPLGPAEVVDIAVGLPPVLKPARVDGMDAGIQLGEWQLKFTREDGEIIDMRIALDAGLTLNITEENSVDLTVDSRPAELILGVDTLAHPDALDSGDLSALGRLLVPSLLGTVSNFIPALDIPPIPLESISADLEGRVINFKSPSIEVRTDGWTVVTGEIAAEAR